LPKPDFQTANMSTRPDRATSAPPNPAPATGPQPGIFRLLRREWPLAIAFGTAGLFLARGSAWLGDLSSLPWFIIVLVWLFGVILLLAFGVVRHAEELAVRLGEPLGTLILTLAVTVIEALMIAEVMASGHGGTTVARDAMFAVVMIVLGGMVGLSLLLGGLRHHEQTYNLQGANAFLAVIIPLSVLGLVLPNFTISSPGPTLSPLQEVFLIVMSLCLYGVFLAIQNVRHRDYFIHPQSAVAATGERPGEPQPHGPHLPSVVHAILLVVYVLPLVVLAEKLALPIDYGIEVLHAPPALGGLLVAVLILAPESLGATRAAIANQLQRAINILLGSVLATISLTIPAVLAIGFLNGQTVVLGLDPANMTLLVLTLAVSMLTFASPRTNVLLGAVHLLLFLAYLMLIFEK
jgi:Ca2+:H+ antiporter